ncbi:hypothetical protein L0F63_005855 [Massospora cicadina]|nr:hypothetical protein L0F63_005855 [Massospora cicadina]
MLPASSFSTRKGPCNLTSGQCRWCGWHSSLAVASVVHPWKAGLNYYAKVQLLANFHVATLPLRLSHAGSPTHLRFGGGSKASKLALAYVKFTKLAGRYRRRFKLGGGWLNCSALVYLVVDHLGLAAGPVLLTRVKVTNPRALWLDTVYFTASPTNLPYIPVDSPPASPTALRLPREAVQSGAQPSPDRSWLPYRLGCRPTIIKHPQSTQACATNFRPPRPTH